MFFVFVIYQRGLVCRFNQIFLCELGLQKQGFFHVAGVDEVGRGPLAGPVVTAAVILDKDRIPDGLNDSKKAFFSPTK